MAREIAFVSIGLFWGVVLALFLSSLWAKKQESSEDKPKVYQSSQNRPDNKKARSYMSYEYRSAMKDSIERERMKRNASVSRNKPK